MFRHRLEVVITQVFVRDSIIKIGSRYQYVAEAETPEVAKQNAYSMVPHDVEYITVIDEPADSGEVSNDAQH